MLIRLFVCLFLTTPFLARSQEVATLADQLERMIAGNPVFKQGYTGFCLYDPELDEYIYEYRADQRFTPASNVKLLTFYLATQLLEGRVPALWYEDYGDHYEVWGTGYPSWEYLEQVRIPRSTIGGAQLRTIEKEFIPEGYAPELGRPNNSGLKIIRSPANPIAAWLLGEGRAVVLNQDGNTPARYGSGWSYDDWNDGYVFERSSFPLYGNRLQISLDSLGQIVVEPAVLTDSVRLVARPDGPRLLREEDRNVFTFDTVRPLRFDYDRSIALHLQPELVAELLQEQTGLEVEVGERELPEASSSRNLLKLPLPDTLYQIMLQQSDNYLAEQFLMLAATSRYDCPDVDQLLEYARDTLLADIAVPEIQWVDGSGLSRYNQVSPRQMTLILDRLQQELGVEALCDYLPANGVSGTLERRFVNARPPFIWAKTGSLRNVMALSGVVRSRSGRYLLFSFLHNHTQEGSSVYYREMEKVFQLLYRNY